MHDDAFHDIIYEAALLPERWVDVLDRLAGIAGAIGSGLHTASAYGQNYVSSPAIRPVIDAWIRSGIIVNPRSEYLVPLQEPRFFTDEDAVPRYVLEHDPYYAVIREAGAGWCVGTTVRSADADTVIVSIERAFAKGPVPREAVEQLDALRPHLARAVLLTARIGLERARASLDAMAAAGLPACVLTATGRVLLANDGMRDLEPIARVGAADRLRLAEPGARARLDALLAGGLNGSGGSLPIRGAEASGAAILHLVPFRRDARDLFSGASWLLYAVRPRPDATPGAELLCGLFDLTPAEARVVRAMMEGLDVGRIAARQGVQANTVRAQLKSVFAKTGVNGQVQLVRLLGALSK